MDPFGAIVLAAGQGVRMRSDQAKVLHRVLGVPMIRLVLRSLRAAGAGPVAVVVGYQAERVRAALEGESVRFVEQAELKGTGHAVLQCEEAARGMPGPLLVLYGDTPLVTPETLQNLVTTHRRAGAAATLLTACLDDPSGYGRILRDPGAGAIRAIVEEADADAAQRAIHEINPGFYAFDAAALFPALHAVRPQNRKGEYYLTDVVQILLARGAKVGTTGAAYPQEVLGVNTRRDLVAATNVLRWRVLERVLDAGVTVVDPSTTYIEEDVVIGADTVIFPFSVIRAGVRVGSHCEVGPFTQLREGTVLEDGAEVGNFVEVKKSRLGAHTKAKHLSYLGDAVVGARVNIGAGTITANFDGRRKHATVIEDEASTGSGTVLVAPVRMGRGSRTGAGAVVPRGRDVPPGATVVGVPARVLEKAKR